MAHCPGCRNPISQQRWFEHAIRPCLRCHGAAFTQSAFEALVDRPYVDASYGALRSDKAKKQGLPCPFCSTPMIRAQAPAGSERLENLRIFPDRRFWHDFHLRGPLEVSHCEPCGSFWMNARTACQLPIDWLAHETRHREAQRTLAAESESDAPDDPLKLMATGFGIPFIENVPEIPGLPAITYGASATILAISWKAFHSRELLIDLAYIPGRTGAHWAASLLTYAWVHASWGHLLGNLAFFLVFAPAVEKELAPEAYALLLATASISSAALQISIQPVPSLGFSGVVSAVLAFFCARFPTAIVGIGIQLGFYRFAAPTALMIFLGIDLNQAIASLLKLRSVSGLGHLGGAIAGLAFHFLTPKGPATQAFQRRALALLDKEKAAKDWRSSR